MSKINTVQYSIPSAFVRTDSTIEYFELFQLNKEIICEMISCIPKKTFSIGQRIYSIAATCLENSRNKVFLTCIALLDTVNFLGEKINFLFPILKEIRSEIIRIIEGSLNEKSFKLPRAIARSVGNKLKEEISQHKVWSNIPAETIRTFTSWIATVLQSLIDMIIGSTFKIYQRFLVVVSKMPGVTIAQSLINQLFSIIDETIRLHVKRNQDKQKNSRFSEEDSQFMAYLISYREKEGILPRNINNRIHGMMHFQVSLRPFEATVLIPSENQELEMNVNKVNSIPSDMFVAVTPQSIPTSPLARFRVQTAFSNFIDDVLFQARDQLRLEKAESLTGEPQSSIPTFNPIDCHEDIYLSCGYHCVSKLGRGMYRSVRATVPIKSNRYIYFQYYLSQITNILPGHLPASDNSTSVCIGLATKDMPLNTLVGTWKHSIGFYSSGHIILGSQWHNYISTDISYGCGNYVGVLVYVDSIECDAGEDMVTAKVQFTIDGKALKDKETLISGTTFNFPKASCIYPTVTLFSSNTQIMSQFTAADLVFPSFDELDVPEGVDIYCLDHTELNFYHLKPKKDE